MSCAIEILVVRGITSPGSLTPHTIHVEGKAEGIVEKTRQRCQKVIVDTDCFKPGMVEVDVDQQTGTWVADIPFPGGDVQCSCGEEIIVSARCKEDETCKDEWAVSVECEEEEECPDVYGITATEGACQDGTRRMTLEAEIWPDGNSAQWYKWEFGDPANSERVITPEAPGDEPWPSTKISFDYPAPGPSGTEVEYDVTFTVVGTTPGCSNTRTTKIGVEGCKGECPTIAGISVTPGDCTHNNTRRTMLIQASIVGGGVTEYRWDFGDGSMLTTTAPSTYHSYAAPSPGNPDQTYSAKLTVSGPAICPVSVMSFNVTVTACGKDERPREKKKCPWWNPKCWFRGLKDFWKELKCFVLGIGLAILVAGYILGVAYCGGQDWEVVLEELSLLALATVGAVVIGTTFIVLALLKYQDKCGPCRLGTWMILGILVAVIVIIILWIFVSPPACILPAGFVAAGFLLAALDRLNECDKQDC